MTNEHKYPYIPKAYYAAVMFACKLIRETGYKNKSIQTAARYYDVDEDEVRKHVDRRAAAGAKGKRSTAKGRKYKWFVIGTVYGSDAAGIIEPNGLQICKGADKNTVLRRFSEGDDKFNRRNDYGGAYSPYRYHVVVGEYETESEAYEALRKAKER